MLFKNLSDAKVLDMHHKFDPQIHLGFSQDVRIKYIHIYLILYCVYSDNIGVLLRIFTAGRTSVSHLALSYNVKITGRWYTFTFFYLTELG